ncbi:unnamed protein product [Amoebophrya sp. A120]|nr:unnamed protein product [Amoebophrya sp. A120]|eukprot:GSA120T00018207001.1
MGVNVISCLVSDGRSPSRKPNYGAPCFQRASSSSSNQNNHEPDTAAAAVPSTRRSGRICASEMKKSGCSSTVGAGAWFSLSVLCSVVPHLNLVEAYKMQAGKIGTKSKSTAGAAAKKQAYYKKMQAGAGAATKKSKSKAGAAAQKQAHKKMQAGEGTQSKSKAGAAAESQAARRVQTEMGRTKSKSKFKAGAAAEKVKAEKVKALAGARTTEAKSSKAATAKTKRSSTITSTTKTRTTSLLQRKQSEREKQKEKERHLRLLVSALKDDDAAASTSKNKTADEGEQDSACCGGGVNDESTSEDEDATNPTNETVKAVTSPSRGGGGGGSTTSFSPKDKDVDTTCENEAGAEIAAPYCPEIDTECRELDGKNFFQADPLIGQEENASELNENTKQQHPPMRHMPDLSALALSVGSTHAYVAHVGVMRGLVQLRDDEITQLLDEKHGAAAGESNHAAESLFPPEDGDTSAEKLKTLLGDDNFMLTSYPAYLYGASGGSWLASLLFYSSGNNTDGSLLNTADYKSDDAQQVWDDFKALYTSTLSKTDTSANDNLKTNAGLLDLFLTSSHQKGVDGKGSELNSDLLLDILLTTPKYGGLARFWANFVNRAFFQAVEQTVDKDKTLPLWHFPSPEDELLRKNTLQPYVVTTVTLLRELLCGTACEKEDFFLLLQEHTPYGVGQVNLGNNEDLYGFFPRKCLQYTMPPEDNSGDRGRYRHMTPAWSAAWSSTVLTGPVDGIYQNLEGFLKQALAHLIPMTTYTVQTAYDDDIDTPAPNSVQNAERYMVGDGGFVDSTSIPACLRRGMKRIVAVMAEDGGLNADLHGYANLMEEGDDGSHVEDEGDDEQDPPPAGTTTCNLELVNQVPISLRALFGFSDNFLDPKTGLWDKLIHDYGMVYTRNQVFHEDDLCPVIRALVENEHNGYVQTFELTTVENEHYGIPEGHNVVITFFLLYATLPPAPTQGALNLAVPPGYAELFKDVAELASYDIAVTTHRGSVDEFAAATGMLSTFITSADEHVASSGANSGSTTVVNATEELAKIQLVPQADLNLTAQVQRQLHRATSIDWFADVVVNSAKKFARAFFLSHMATWITLHEENKKHFVFDADTVKNSGVVLTLPLPVDEAETDSSV